MPIQHLIGIRKKIIKKHNEEQKLQQLVFLNYFN